VETLDGRRHLKRREVHGKSDEHERREQAQQPSLCGDGSGACRYDDGEA
jgi:hypothetical protein